MAVVHFIYNGRTILTDSAPSTAYPPIGSVVIKSDESYYVDSLTVRGGEGGLAKFVRSIEVQLKLCSAR